MGFKPLSLHRAILFSEELQQIVAFTSIHVQQTKRMHVLVTLQLEDTHPSIQIMVLTSVLFQEIWYIGVFNYTSHYESYKLARKWNTN